jgi:hypothetical protein
VLLASGGFDHTVVLWNAATGAEVARAAAAAPEALVGAAVPSGSTVRNGSSRARGRCGGRGGSGSGSGSSRSSNIASGASTSQSRCGKAAAKSAGAAAASAAAAVAETTASGGTLADGTAPSTGRLFNPPFVHALAWSPGSALLAAAYGDGSVAVWRIASAATRAFVCKWDAHAGAAATCVAFVDGVGPGQGHGLLATAGNDGYVCLWAVPAAGVPGASDAAPAAGCGGGSRGTDTAADAGTGAAAATPGCVWRHKHGRGPNALVAVPGPPHAAALFDPEAQSGGGKRATGCGASSAAAADAAVGQRSVVGSAACGGRRAGERDGTTEAAAFEFALVVADTRRAATVYNIQASL